MNVVTCDRNRDVGVDSVLVADRLRARPLLRVRQLAPAWKPPAPPQPSLQDRAADVLGLVLRLVGIGVVLRLRLGTRVRFLRWPSSGPDLTSPPAIETGTFALTAFCCSVPSSRLPAPCWRAERRPELHRTAAASCAGQTATDGLVLRLVLRGVSVVLRLRIGLRVGGLIRRARARGNVSTCDRDRDVGVHGVLVADRLRLRSLLGVGGWAPIWAPPAPPQPTAHEEPPTFCV